MHRRERPCCLTQANPEGLEVTNQTTEALRAWRGLVAWEWPVFQFDRNMDER